LAVRNGEKQTVSEFERYVRDLSPLRQSVALEGLTAADVNFLHGETQIPAAFIAWLSIAHRHAKTARVAPEVFYGLFRQDLPTNLPALLLQPAQKLRAALQRSVAGNIIPPQPNNEVERAVDNLHALLGSHVVEAGRAPILEASGVPLRIQEKFLREYAQTEGEKPPEDFWATLRADPDFAKSGYVDDIEFALQTSVVTRNNVPLVKALQNLRRKGGIKTTRDLVHLKTSQWEALILRTKTGKKIAFPPDTIGQSEKEKVHFYALLISETLKATFPTSAVAVGISEASPKLFGANGKSVQADLSRFFSNAPDFDFGTHIDRYLAREGKRALKGWLTKKPPARSSNRYRGSSTLRLGGITSNRC
jgi:hypothetical protein